MTKTHNFMANDKYAASDAAKADRFSALIGTNLKKKRARINLSLRDVAKEVNISNSTLSRYETAAIDMPMSAMVELCRFYGCRIGECVADADGLIMAENIDTLARKASKEKADRVLNKRKSRRKAKELSDAEQNELNYVCDIASAGAKVLAKIESMDMPMDYRAVIERDLSECILDIIEARASENTLQRLSGYTARFRKSLNNSPKEV